LVGSDTPISGTEESAASSLTAGCRITGATRSPTSRGPKTFRQRPIIFADDLTLIHEAAIIKSFLKFRFSV
jgi:hypothetical protein